MSETIFVSSCSAGKSTVIALSTKLFDQVLAELNRVVDKLSKGKITTVKKVLAGVTVKHIPLTTMIVEKKIHAKKSKGHGLRDPKRGKKK